MTTEERKETIAAFEEAVNIPPARLMKWLESDDSKRVGFKGDGEGESVGHRSGERIVEIKKKKVADLTDDDLAHMKKVVGYVARHSKQGPKSDVEHSNWRYSLMNWGHDPPKDPSPDSVLEAHGRAPQFRDRDADFDQIVEENLPFVRGVDLDDRQEDAPGLRFSVRGTQTSAELVAGLLEPEHVRAVVGVAHRVGLAVPNADGFDVSVPHPDIVG